MKYLSPTLFLAIVLFFALPFGAVVSCDGTTHFDWTGFDLLTASVEAGPEDASDAAEVEERWILAWPVFLCAVAGLLLGLAWGARYAGWVAAAGLVATFALLTVPQRVVNEQPDLGVALTLLTFAVLTLLHGVAAAVRWWGRYRAKRGERNESPQQAFR